MPLDPKDPIDASINQTGAPRARDDSASERQPSPDLTVPSGTEQRRRDCAADHLGRHSRLSERIKLHLAGADFGPPDESDAHWRRFNQSPTKE